MPSASTITEILRRHDKLDAAAAGPARWCRFERAGPNELWQMDFKGHFATVAGRCHPLTVLDDHGATRSRSPPAPTSARRRCASG